MKWKKLKHLFAPENNFDWMVSHAANPFAEKIENNLFRIYFTCRDKANRSYISSLEMDMETLEIVKIDEEPLLSPGEPGLFDDSGVALGCVKIISEKKFLYYLGWNLGVTVPWRNTIGLAVYNEAQKRFQKYSRVPLMDRSEEDPFSISYPWIIEEQGIYKMWYGSNLKWGKDQSEMQHVVKYAESNDGIHWKRSFDTAVGLIHPNEYALSKPIVIKEDNYKMWYSYRGCGNISTYRIGFAESVDGRTWVRKDKEAGIDVSDSGWDSEMICYPCVFEHKGSMYMLYNGNGYGKTGFGIAVRN